MVQQVGFKGILRTNTGRPVSIVNYVLITMRPLSLMYKKLEVKKKRNAGAAIPTDFTRKMCA